MLNNDRARTKTSACGFLSLPIPPTLKLELHKNELLVSTFKKNEEIKRKKGNRKKKKTLKKFDGIKINTENG